MNVHDKLLLVLLYVYGGTLRKLELWQEICALRESTVVSVKCLPSRMEMNISLLSLRELSYVVLTDNGFELTVSGNSELSIEFILALGAEMANE